jgi:hypothetical protein
VSIEIYSIFVFFLFQSKAIIDFQGLDEIKCFNLNFFTQHEGAKWINSLTTIGKHLSKSYLIRHSRHITLNICKVRFSLACAYWEKLGNLTTIHTNTLKSKREMALKTKQPPPLSFVGQTKQHQSQKGETLACSHPHKNIWNKKHS